MAIPYPDLNIKPHTPSLMILAWIAGVVSSNKLIQGLHKSQMSMAIPYSDLGIDQSHTKLDVISLNC